MLLTQRDNIQKAIDEKFARYKEMKIQIIKEKNELNAQHEELLRKLKKQKAENDREAMEHTKRLKKNLKEQLENGCAEYANLLVSLYNHQYVGNADDI